MYCVKCVVKLEDTEKMCPLCGTVVFHPDIKRDEVERLYPENNYPKQHINTFAAMIIITTLFLTPILITLLCDLKVNAAVTWSGYVMGALVLAYIMIVLPFWFKRPNPVIFVPCSFAALGGYLWYINFAVDGDWFLCFAFPLVTGIGLTVTAVVTLVKYLKHGMLYIFGGAILLLGILSPGLELLVNITFAIEKFSFWSIYPLVASLLMGGLLIFLAINKSFREKMERKFFI